jgi:hypothetical protein
MAQFLTSQAAAVGGSGLLGLWFALALWRRIRLHRDIIALEEWLWTYTEDEPGKSHRTVSELARGLNVSAARINRAVSYSRAIYRSVGQVELVSVWCQEPLPRDEDQPALEGASGD